MRRRTGWKLAGPLGLAALLSGCPAPSPPQQVLALATALDEARTLRQGPLVDLGEAGFRPHLVRGWSHDERWFEGETWVWARSQRAELELLLGPEEVQGDRFLEFRGVPFRFEGAPHQSARVTVNGLPLAELELPDHTSVQRVLLPSRLLREGRNRLRFEFGYASPPPTDPGSRALAVAFDYVRLAAADGCGASGRPVMRGALPARPHPRRLDADSLRALRESQTGDWNVVLISVDTLRPDHLGAYGYERETSPNLDALAADGVLFLTTIAQAPSTLPSHASLFTSMVPAHHGAFFSGPRALPDRVTTLAEVLRQHGYATAAYHGGGQVAPELGLGQGFDTYRAVETRFAEAVASARDWLEENARRRFFLFLHTYETHAPYAPELRFLDLFDDGYTGDLPDRIGVEEHLLPINGLAGPRRALGEADLEHVVDVYDAGIRSVDEALGELVRFLEERDLYDRTLIVLTSDHGEELGEHGFVGWHGHTLFDELLQVPLVVKLPGSQLAGARVARQVRSLDVAPTVLDVLRIPAPESFEGASLLDAGAAEDAASGLAWSETEPGAEAAGTISLRSSRWKLYGPRLYDLRADPAESADVAREHPELVQSLSARRSQIAAEAAGEAAQTARLSEATRERLRELGYVE